MKWIEADWPAPPWVRALTTTRLGGASHGRYAGLNLGDHVGDAPAKVAANRDLLCGILNLPRPPLWLHQVHGCSVVDEVSAKAGCEGDAVIGWDPGQVCAVLTADCLPILLTDHAGSRVAAIHAGWRGLAAGVIEATVSRLTSAPSNLLAWLGPAIGPQAFEVGPEVREHFLARDSAAGAAFVAHPGGKWLADIFLLARQRLAKLGVEEVWGGGLCTYADPEHFYSHRRDGITGRMASLIWLREKS